VWPIVATISVAMENSDKPSVVQVCLDVYRCAVHIAATFEMATEREVCTCPLVPSIAFPFPFLVPLPPRIGSSTCRHLHVTVSRGT